MLSWSMIRPRGNRVPYVSPWEPAMTTTRTVWLLVLGAVCVASCAVADDTAWEKYMKAGTEAYQQGQYAEAQKQFAAALREAEEFGEQDLRVGVSFNSLAMLYNAQGKYGEAEPLFRRALAIAEKALGLEHPNVAASLNNLAGLYQAQGKYAEASRCSGARWRLRRRPWDWSIPA